MNEEIIPVGDGLMAQVERDSELTYNPVTVESILGEESSEDIDSEESESSPLSEEEAQILEQEIGRASCRERV